MGKSHVLMNHCRSEPPAARLHDLFPRTFTEHIYPRTYLFQVPCIQEHTLLP